MRNFCQHIILVEVSRAIGDDCSSNNMDRSTGCEICLQSINLSYYSKDILLLATYPKPDIRIPW